MPTSSGDPAARFTGLADLYARCRPSYPDVALDFTVAQCGLQPGSALADVGCGTGISSRLFAGRGLSVIGIEPNEEMRRRAESEALPASVTAPVYCAGRAEATGLPDGCVDAVLAAQAFHWFDTEAALREFHRILRPGGWTVLIWNERDEADPFTAAYGAVVRTLPDAIALETPRARAGDVLLASPHYQNAKKGCFRNEQALDEAGLLGRAFSVSYAPREPVKAEAFAAALREVFARFQCGGKVILQYATSVTLGQR